MENIKLSEITSSQLGLINLRNKAFNDLQDCYDKLDEYRQLSYKHEKEVDEIDSIMRTVRYAIESAQDELLKTNPKIK
jgi:hypothetical protein